MLLYPKSAISSFYLHETPINFRIKFLITILIALSLYTIYYNVIMRFIFEKKN